MCHGRSAYYALYPNQLQVYPFITLPDANITPENGWLEDVFPICEGLFSGAMSVLGRVL